MSIEAVKTKLKISKYTFELVGYDFMLILSPPASGDNPQSVDPQNTGSSSSCVFETRLIEVNTNPCLEEPNAILKTYLPRMADDMLRLTIDPLFGTVPMSVGASEDAVIDSGVPNTPPSQYHVPGFSSKVNMFRHIHTLTI
jgi:hypothetical protein